MTGDLRREGRSEQISRIGGNAAALSFHFRIGSFFWLMVFFIFILLYCKCGGDLDSDECLVSRIQMYPSHMWRKHGGN